MSGEIIIPAMTLWQPWACLVEIRAKPYETRGKPPPKRLIGKRIAIHAAARKQRMSDMDDETHEVICDAFGNCHWFHTLPLGVVVCTAILTEALPVENVPHDAFGNYAPGRWAWKLDDVIPVNPHVPAKGMQTWGWNWLVPDGVNIGTIPRDDLFDRPATQHREGG